MCIFIIGASSCAVPHCLWVSQYMLQLHFFSVQLLCMSSHCMFLAIIAADACFLIFPLLPGDFFVVRMLQFSNVDFTEIDEQWESYGERRHP